MNLAKPEHAELIRDNALHITWADVLASSNGRAERFRDQFSDDGLLKGDSLVATLEQWAQLGAPPYNHEAELFDEWLLLQAILASVIGSTRQRLALKSVGYVGAEGARVSLLVDGWVADDCLEFTHWGARQLPIPVVAHLLSLNQEFAATRASQLARWAKMRTVVETIRGHLAHLINIDIDPHLDSLNVRRPELFGLRWRPSGSNVVSLELFEVRPDGTQVPLDLAALDLRSGIVANSAKEPILLPDAIVEVAKQVQKRQYQLTKKVHDEIANPACIIPEGIDADAWLDLRDYSKRVLGFERVRRADKPLVFQSSGVKWYEEQDDSAPFLRLPFKAPDRTELIPLVITTPEEAYNLFNRVENAMAQAGHAGEAQVQYGEAVFAATPELRDTLFRAIRLHDEREKSAAAAGHPPIAPRPGRFAALIDPKEASDVFDLHGIVIDESRTPWGRLERLLRVGVQLKPHQRRGLAWMWQHWKNREPGILLADDMGLGKTLQVACFLALRMTEVECGPNLIVAPTMLLASWREELERFFNPGVFGDLAILHGDGLSRYRLNQNELDVQRLSAHRVIITNYETLASHQVSLLRIDFTTVVLDEAQAIKNETTLRARAARGLKREFAIAMTGTPVENRLSDLWAIFDALQPDSARRAFGDRAEFERKYESVGQSGVQKVRERLSFPTEASVMLRREKREALRDLPPKTYHTIAVPMTSTQYELERVIAREMRTAGPLEILDRLRKLYQHPALLDGSVFDLDPASALQESPKTRATLQILADVAKRGEKALVFTQWVQMQDLLARILRATFGLQQVRIINGDPRRRSLAQQTIAEFSRTPGFDVLVLSPLAAGVGLTITAANHVIHYGRWWNPAKEDQATDRAYRIGQTKPVHVYYPTLHHPHDRNGGFDLKLHELVEQKRKVARDFLSPADDDGLDREVEHLFTSEAERA